MRKTEDAGIVRPWEQPQDDRGLSPGFALLAVFLGALELVLDVYDLGVVDLPRHSRLDDLRPLDVRGLVVFVAVVERPVHVHALDLVQDSHWFVV